MKNSIRMFARKIFLSMKNNIETIQIDDLTAYEELQRRPGQLEYLHPREMISSSLNYFIPKLDKICKNLELQRREFSVLDAGARDGWTVEEFSKLGFRAQGLELVTELVEHAQSLGRDVVKGDIQSMPFPDAHFNAAFCRHTLEHTTNPMKALSELIRVTAPGGLIYVSLPLERATHGKHTAAIPNLRVLKRLVKGMNAQVIELQKSSKTGVIIPDEDEALMILRRI